MSALLKHSRLAALLLATAVPTATLADVEDVAMGEVVERNLDDNQLFTPWVLDEGRVDESMADTLETREVLGEQLETIKLSGVVPPIYFESGVAQIPDGTISSLAEVLDGMRDRINVRLHLVGHADNQPLSARLQAIYGDNLGLSRERAGQVAEYFQNALTLPPEGVSYSWLGDSDPVASNDSAAGRALNRRVEVEVWYDEPRDKVELEEYLVPHEIKQVKVCRMETVCKLRYVDGHARRARVRNVVAPLNYDEDAIEVSDDFVDRVAQSYENLANKQNVVIKFVGFTDSQPLAGRAARIYGDHLGLSKARARRVALAVQDELGLSTAAIDSDGRGSERPIGSNATTAGRALNRRVEVEFWYDDPLQELPNEPQICPEDAGAELVTRVYVPEWGAIGNIAIVDGRPVIPPGYTATLERALSDIADKKNPRLRFVGYTRNERLQRRTASVYGDDIGLSASRARRAMSEVADTMGLEARSVEFEGRGFVHADDVITAGFVQGEASFVAVQPVYDELAVLDDYEGVDIRRVTRELEPQNPLGLNLMRIKVDGVPISDPERSSSDIQRCTDVALEAAEIRFGYDNLRSSPRLSVTASPERVTINRIRPRQGPAFAMSSVARYDAAPVEFRMYANYSHFIDRAEVRVFENGRSLESEPLAIIPIDDKGVASWQPPVENFRGPVGELAYVLRAYGKDGNFDETDPSALWMVHGGTIDAPLDDRPPPEPVQELHAAWGENTLALHNIGLSSGTVTVQGSGVPEGHEVFVAGRPVPVADDGSFVSEEILPTGAHTVEVAVLDEEGRGDLYLRDFEFEERDWFYVALADVTLSENSSNGPVELFQGDNAREDITSNADGRFAFFVNGKFDKHWKLTAAADTREGPLDTLFSNLMEKDPVSLFRRIDPDYYYPTFGDDSTVTEYAPTSGKFFLRVGDGDNFGQWGNFKIGYNNNELARVDRGLYGGNFHFQSDATTEFGEQRYAFDGFAAEPGTVASQEEFRGTGGSLYFLGRQDLLVGSERVRIEIRDKASGIVTGVRNLVPVLDYDIDYIQGRIVLTEPLASTANDGLLVRNNALSGDEAYLVIRYEYTPGFGRIDAVAMGGQGHAWIGDYVKLGFTTNANEQDSEDSSLNGFDVTFRLAAETWLKVQTAESEGLVQLPQLSNDGGYEFQTFDAAGFVNAEAGADRIDLSLSSRDLINRGNARLTYYTQDIEAGYSAPGFAVLTDTRNYGGSIDLPVGDRFSMGAKLDYIEQDLGLESSAGEINVGYRLGERWDVSAGYRVDERTDNAPIVALTQEEGERADAVLQVGFDSRADWSSYAFMQDTVSVTGNRQENSRYGVGGSYRVTDRLTIDGEFSDGDLGVGGRVGSNYLHSERTSMYLNYALENERTDNGLRSGRGREGNLVAGIKTRLGDSTSIFLEERYQHSTVMTGLTHATGMNFTPADSWNLGLNTDIGTLQDLQTGAETERLAGGLQIGYGTQNLQLSSGVEYRNDDVEQPDLSRIERKTWLYRNSFKYQINDGARLLGKFNHSDSTSSAGSFFEGGFTEGVLGYALRPVSHDRVNVLAKYTYFYNMPTADQQSVANTRLDFVQKSHIAAVDVTYDLTPGVTIGGKYAYRLGQVSLDRENPEFFDNNASLYVVRGDYRFRKNYEFLLEGRLLSMGDLDESRSGVLAVLSRYVGDNMKVGVGYNFTDFSDDLTDLSYDHQGVFLNLTGSL